MFKLNTPNRQEMLPAGTYYIGDPCYVFAESWDSVLEETDFFRKENQTINGVPVFGASTAFGDGSYPGSNRFYYPVDAGLLGAIPVELMEGSHDGVGTIISAPNGLVCCSADDGSFTFAAIGGEKIFIETHEEEDDEYDDDEEDDY